MAAANRRAFGPLERDELQQLGRMAGALLIVGALASFPAGLVLEPAPDVTDHLVGLSVLITGLAAFFAPWERLSPAWLHVVLVLAVLEIAVGTAIFSDDFAFYYVVVGMYAAYVIRDPVIFLVYVLLFLLALAAPLAYADEELSEQVHHILVTAPVFIIAVVIVRYLRDTLERRQDDYRRFAFEAVSLAERIRGRPDDGQARDLEERLGRLVDGERGQQAGQ